MNLKINILALALAASAASIHTASAVTLVVNNPDFTGSFGTAPSWITVESTAGTNNADPVYQEAGFLHFKDGLGTTDTIYAQQNISANNVGVFGQSYSSYTATMDIGWRGDLNDRNNAEFRISLINLTTGTELAFTTYTLVVRPTGSADLRQITAPNQAFTLTYDNTAAANQGAEIALRIARTDADTTDGTAGVGNFASTAIFDNVRLDAVPEPQAALLGLLGLAGLARRRRSR